MIFFPLHWLDSSKQFCNFSAVISRQVFQCIPLLGSSQISQLHTFHVRKMLRKTSSIRFCIFNSKNVHFSAASQGSSMLHVMPPSVTQIICVTETSKWHLLSFSEDTNALLAIQRNVQGCWGSFFPKKMFKFWCAFKLDKYFLTHWFGSFSCKIKQDKSIYCNSK